MNVLLISPDTPNTFWSLKYALDVISKQAALPPLGLLTIAAMLPRDWQLKLADMNVAPLKNQDIQWADMVFIGAMHIQRSSANRIIRKCKHLGKTIVAGGPLFTAIPDEYETVDHLVLDEAEITLPRFLDDLAAGSPKHVYRAQAARADMHSSPIPRYDIIDMKPYALASVQYSRGCPWDCEFCNITALFGRKYRTKTSQQVIAELDNIYNSGWRGNVFFVDDNFIGQKAILKRDILPAIIKWRRTRKYPFYFNTQASIDMADDQELMNLMTQAGFNCVFIGIETPSQENLDECSKTQNKDRDLVECVKKIQRSGIEVQGGFILGFDHDNQGSFDALIDFIQKSGIIAAMVGLLNAPHGTRLYDRLAGQGRLKPYVSGDNTDFTINFETIMPRIQLLKGYENVIQTIYSHKNYYDRIMTFLNTYKPVASSHIRLSFSDIKTFARSIWFIGIKDPGRKYYWKAIFQALRRPRCFSIIVAFTIKGLHYRKTFEDLRPNLKYLNKNCSPAERSETITT